MAVNNYSQNRAGNRNDSVRGANTGRTSNAQNSTGMLAVQAYIADRAIPVEGANVIISKQNDAGKEEVVRILKTNASGTTETVELPAPPAANSLSPGNGEKYYTYNIRVDRPGYYTVENRNVPVFAGNKSIQPAAMLPLPDGEEKGKRITFVEEEPQELE